MDRTCTDQQAAYLDGDLDAATHVDQCSTCEPERPHLDDLKALLGHESLWIEPPADLEERVVAAARNATPSEEPASAAPASARPATDVPSSDELSARRRRRQSIAPRYLRPLSVAAAAFLIGGGLGAGAIEYAHRKPNFPQEVALAGTSRAPGAHATAHIRTTALGLEIHLDVVGLPTTPRGSFYEAWLKGPSGLVPIGTFHTGAGEISLWSGVTLQTHPTMTVTIQNDNGNSQSTGRQVLIGTLAH